MKTALLTQAQPVDAPESGTSTSIPEFNLRPSSEPPPFSEEVDDRLRELFYKKAPGMIADAAFEGANLPSKWVDQVPGGRSLYREAKAFSEIKKGKS